MFDAVEDLSTYPRWLGIVGSAEPVDAHVDDAGPAWQVALQARLGPLVRRKQVRMVRTAHEPLTSVRFERREQDGETHGTWVLSSMVTPAGDGTDLLVSVHYSGLTWVPGLDRLLREEAKRAGRRLDALLAD